MSIGSGSPLWHPTVAAAAGAVIVTIWAPGRPWDVLASLFVLAVCVISGTGSAGRFRTHAGDPRAELQLIGDCLADTVPQRANQVREELEQIRFLVADAVGTLNAAFGEMSHDAAAQRALIDEMTAALTDGAITENLTAEQGLQTGDEATAGQESPEALEPRRGITIGSFIRKTAELFAEFVALKAASHEQSLQMVTKIDEMSARTHQMTEILTGIRRIADQTKLVSLNARIEAASAGEAGMSFAVVAAEVHELSQSSDQLSIEILNEVDEMRRIMKATRDAVDTATFEEAETLQRGKEDLDQMTTQVSYLDEMLNRQADAAGQISNRLGTGTADAIRSLQFEDIVRQVAEHADDAMVEILQFLEQLPAKVSDPRARTVTQVRGSIVAAAEDLAASRSPGPAVQQSLDNGSVDLF